MAEEGAPTGSDLAYTTVNMFDLSVYGWVLFTLNQGVSIVSGTKYAIIVGTSNVILADAAEWAQTLSDVYAGGNKCLSSDSGVTWANVQVSTRELGFRTYAGVTKKDYYEPGDIEFGAKQYVYDPYYLAQTFTASSSYTLTSVELPLGKGAGTPSGTAIISIRATVVAPGKATNPTPADDTEGVYIRGIDRLTQLTWDAPA